MKIIIILAICLGLFSPPSCPAATDTLSNAAPRTQGYAFRPGAILLLPDGRQAVIMDQLENGDFMTDLDIVISPEGIARNGEIRGQVVRLDPEFYAAYEKPDNAAIEAPVAPEKTVAASPDQAIRVPAPETVAPKIEITPQKPIHEPVQANRKPGASQSEQERLTLAELLPMTNIVTGKPQASKALPDLPEKAGKPAQEAKKPTPEKPAPKQPEQTRKKETPPKAVEQPKKEQPKSAKAKNGEEMRIPPEAIRSGNLDFLEGCWQGTRPEYYSKRTIRECFCFGASGKSGKRRIYDHGRMCIGGTRASLSQNGVLSVTSSGAACNDGEKWGSAEMQCRNSGPRTPCSWIFRDANNGQQSYVIPFIRVESCGR